MQIALVDEILAGIKLIVGDRKIGNYRIKALCSKCSKNKFERK